MPSSTTVIAARTRVVGTIEAAAGVLIEGRFEGEVNAGGTVTIAAGAACLADLRARAAEIYGEVIGAVTCSDSIIVGAGARVVGDLRAPEVSVDAAAAVEGRVDLLAPAPRPTPAARRPVGTRGPAPRRPSLPAPTEPESAPGEPVPEAAPARNIPRAPRPIGRVRIDSRPAGTDEGGE